MDRPPLGGRTWQSFSSRQLPAAKARRSPTTTSDARGRLETITDPRGHVTTHAYDAFGRHTSVTNPLGHSTSTHFDDRGRADAFVDALGNRTTFVFDSRGRQEAVIDALGNRTTTVYDAFGRPEATVDPLNHRTTTVYDAFGRAAASIDALGARTTITFDSLGRRQSLTDAENNVTTFAYDVLGRLSAQTDPLNHTATFAYDSMGRLSSTTDRLGRRRDFDYDLNGRLLNETWIAADGSTVDDVFTFTYDAVGNQLTASNSAGTHTLTYDALNRVTGVSQPTGVVLTMAYDKAGNRTSLEDSFGSITTSTYDAAGRLSERKVRQGDTLAQVTFAYDAAGRATSQTRTTHDLSGPGPAPQILSTFAYDALHRVTEIHHGGASPTDYLYTFDAASRLTVKSENSVLTTYTYDLTNQLTADGINDIAYDANGNRESNGNATYTTGPGNQLLSDGTWDYTYDLEGNVTEKERIGTDEKWTYIYNHRNQLIRAEHSTDGSTVDREAEYKYDAWSNRIQKDVDADGAGTGNIVTTKFALDGWNSAKPRPLGTENFDIVADMAANGSLTTRYLLGDAVDQRFARLDADDSAQWYLTDHLGSIRDIVTPTGTSLDRLAYDGFGNIISETTPAERGRYAYTSREYDVETDLQYNRARYYDAATGRWVTQDPLGFDAGDSNLYRYVRNRTTSLVDPSGLQSPSISSAASKRSYVPSAYEDHRGSTTAGLPPSAFKAIERMIEPPPPASTVIDGVHHRITYAATALKREADAKIAEQAAPVQPTIGVRSLKQPEDEIMIPILLLKLDIPVYEIDEMSHWEADYQRKGGDSKWSPMTSRLDHPFQKILWEDKRRREAERQEWQRVILGREAMQQTLGFPGTEEEHAAFVERERQVLRMFIGFVPLVGSGVSIAECWQSKDWKGVAFGIVMLGVELLPVAKAGASALRGGSELRVAPQGSGTFFRNGAVGGLSSEESQRMLDIARRWATRVGVDPAEIHAIRELGGSATGATMGGRIFLDPRAFRQVYDSRLGRMVSPMENLSRNIIHEHAHVLQSVQRADLYWSGTAASRELLEGVAYRFEDIFYIVVQRRLAGR